MPNRTLLRSSLVSRLPCEPEDRRCARADSGSQASGLSEVDWQIERHNPTSDLRPPASRRLFELHLMQSPVQIAPPEELLVSANVGNSAGLHDQDAIGQCQGR